MKVKNYIISICILLSVNACEQFRTRPNIGELGRILEAKSIRDMQVIDTSVVDIFVHKASMQYRYDMDEYVNVVDYIPLETSEKILIGNIDKLFVYNNHIYILDARIAKSIFIFHYDGRFKTKISKNGQGRSEYTYLRDMEIDTINKRLTVYDRNDGKLLFFDLDGNYINAQKVGFRFSNFKFFPNGSILFYTDNNPNEFNFEISGFSVLIGQLSGKMFYRGLKNSSFLENLKYTDGYSLCEDNGKVILSPRLSNTIYEIDPIGNLKKLYQMHFPLGNMENYEILDLSNFTQEMTKSGYYYSLGGNTLLNDSLFHFRFIDPEGIINTLWYNRNNGKHRIVNMQRSSSGKVINVPIPLFSINNQCVGIIDALQVFQSKSTFIEAHRKDKEGLSETLLSKIENMTENDNPLLMIYTVNWNK
jgi:hypothetical protein